MQIAAGFMRESQQLATNAARRRTAETSSQYEQAYRAGDLVIVVEEASVRQAAAAYVPPKLASPVKPRVYIVVEALANGSVRIRPNTRRFEDPREISVSKLRRYQYFSNGQLAAEDPDGILEARVGDLVLVEVAPPRNRRLHRPYPARVLSVRGSKLQLQLYRSGTNEKTLEPPLLPLWMKSRKVGNGTPKNLVAQEEKEPSWAPYDFEATAENIVSEPFMRFTVGGRVPLQAMKQAHSGPMHLRMQVQEGPDWATLLAACEDDPTVMRRW